jgi:general stress protein YciG
MPNQDKNSERGFASMDPEKQREIASKGGKAAHEKGTAHEFTHEEAVEAGRKGGEARSSNSSQGSSESGSSGGRQNSGQFNSESAREAGKKGGQH